jgi:Zn-dependent protease
MQSARLEWFFPFFQGLLVGLAAMFLHEGGHIATAIGLGVKVKKVGIQWNKGVYTVREKGPLNKNLLIALAGPLTNVLLIPTCYWSPMFGLANFCYAIANLLPVEGSDGSRILGCWQEMRKKNLSIG